MNQKKTLFNKDFVQKFIKKKKTFHLDAFGLQAITKALYVVTIEMLERPNDTTHEYTVAKNSTGKQDLTKAIKNQKIEC